MNLELKKFDMKSIKFTSGRECNGPVIVFIGTTRYRKEFL